MKERLKQIISRFKADNPQVRGWNDEQVLDKMFRIAAEQYPSRIAKVGDRTDGTAIFTIDLSTDGSDGST